MSRYNDNYQLIQENLTVKFISLSEPTPSKYKPNVPSVVYTATFQDINGKTYRFFDDSKKWNSETGLAALLHEAMVEAKKTSEPFWVTGLDYKKNVMTGNNALHISKTMKLLSENEIMNLL